MKTTQTKLRKHKFSQYSIDPSEYIQDGIIDVTKLIGRYAVVRVARTTKLLFKKIRDVCILNNTGVYNTKDPWTNIFYFSLQDEADVWYRGIFYLDYAENNTKNTIRHIIHDDDIRENTGLILDIYQPPEPPEKPKSPKPKQENIIPPGFFEELRRKYEEERRNTQPPKPLYPIHPLERPWVIPQPTYKPERIRPDEIWCSSRDEESIAAMALEHELERLMFSGQNPNNRN